MDPSVHPESQQQPPSSQQQPPQSQPPQEESQFDLEQGQCCYVDQDNKDNEASPPAAAAAATTTTTPTTTTVVVKQPQQQQQQPRWLEHQQQEKKEEEEEDVENPNSRSLVIVNDDDNDNDEKNIKELRESHTNTGWRRKQVNSSCSSHKHTTCLRQRRSNGTALLVLSSSGHSHSSQQHPPSSSSTTHHHHHSVVARGETRAVLILRWAILVVLAVTASLVSWAVHRYTAQDQSSIFHVRYQNNARKILQNFEEAVQRRLGSINTLSTSMTSLAITTNQSFPFVTIPDFALRGSDLRTQADALVIHYMPLVTDDNRLEWEAYALANRFQINVAFEQDAAFRARQDAEFGYTSSRTEGGNRRIRGLDDANLDAEEDDDEDYPGLTVLPDGTGFHPRIWSQGAVTPKGDEADGSGPYLPLWQRSPLLFSPIDAGKQDILNWDFATTHAFTGLLSTLLETKQAIMNRASSAVTMEGQPQPQGSSSGGSDSDSGGSDSSGSGGRHDLEADLALSQFRRDAQDYLDDPSTFIAYPVFDSFDDDTKQIGGVLATTINWKVFFENILSSNAQGYLCVLENSYNQTLTYRLNGQEATFVGDYDAHDPRYNYLQESASINDYLQQNAGPRTRSYTTVPLSREFGKYTLRVYPSRPTQQTYVNNDPIVYTVVILSVFLVTSLVFITFALVVERRQRIVMATAIGHAEKAATTERDLNEFFSHEIRNPLAAAISACSFVQGALRGGEQSQRRIYQDDFKKGLEEDVKVIDTSLCFVNDFLRSMLDMHRATVEEAEFVLTPANLLRDVLQPVCTMLKQRCFNFEVSCECPENLTVATYALCLKQILLHLGVTATNSVVQGFVRFRAAVVQGLVELYIEDSGPGMVRKDRDRFLSSAASPPPPAAAAARTTTRTTTTTPPDDYYGMRDGTGIALSFSRRLITALRGEIRVDEQYDSGIAGHPGTRYIIQLNRAPEPVEEEKSGTTIQAPTTSTTTTTALANKTNHMDPTTAFTRRPPGPIEIGRPRSPPGSSSSSSNLRMVVEQTNGSMDPSAPPENDSSSSPPPFSPNKLPESVSVLIVDDDVILRKLFTRAVMRVAPTWTVQQAESGEKAVQLLQSTQGGENDGVDSNTHPASSRPTTTTTSSFAIIFMDQYMPSGTGEPAMLGTETIQVLRSKGVSSRICGVSANDLERSFLDAGADCFHLKPIPAEKNAMEHWLGSVLSSCSRNGMKE